MAFFLEAAFLGVLLFGRKLVPPWVHFASAIVVATGTLFSAFWILAANSWMQTPAGFEVINGRFVATNWIEAIFNPSFPYRLAHTVVAVYLTTAFTVIGAAAWYLRHGRYAEESRLMITMGVLLATVLLPLQLLIGDLHGVNTLTHQPQKLAAIEGIWEGGPGQPAILFAIPDESLEKNHAEIGIPKLGSLYLTHTWDGHVKGLKDFPKDERPPVTLPFFGFRVMVGMWLLMLGITVWAWIVRGRRYDSRPFLYAATACIPAGYVAVTAGWITTEVGRQPWIVYGHLRTADGVSPNLTGPDVLISLALYVIVYTIIFGTGVYYLVRLVQRGMPEDLPEAREDRRPARPLSAATTTD
jgi:cytochrome d ubiquinol oxidase subunit I